VVDFRAELAALVAVYDKHGVQFSRVDEDAMYEAFERARAALLAQPEPTPAADGEVAELVEWLRVTGELLSRRSDIQCRIDLRLFHRAADLLERQALRPIPVSERLPGPGDCDERGRCWWYEMRRWRLAGPMEDSEEYMNVLAACFSHWLGAHALPLPEVER